MKLSLALLLASATALLALETPREHLPPQQVTAIPEKKLPEDTRPFENNPSGGGMTVEGHEETLQSYSSATVTFPAAVVGADKIDAEGLDSPVVAWPVLDISFLWRTQTSGTMTMNGPFIPGQTYRFRLREGLKDLAGQSLPEKEWGFEMKTALLRVTDNDYGGRNELNSRPQVPLEFNYPIRLTDAAQGIWIQDRKTRERHPVEILLNSPSGELDEKEEVASKEALPEDITAFRVRPLKALPVGGYYDLVVDGVRDAYAGRGLSYPRVFPLGTTRPLHIEYVMARNFPLEKPRVEVKFRQLLGDDPLPKDALGFSPAVQNLHFRRDGSMLIAEGDFDTSMQYAVTISPGITSVGGYGLSGPEKWKATFHPKIAAILFPDRQLRERSTLGLSMAFQQVNTAGLEWKLAPIPLERLAEVQEREEDSHDQRFNSDGDPLWTEEGTFVYATSKPLIPDLGLSPIASGTVEGDMSGREVLREIHWKPTDTGTLEGPMLFEVTGRDGKGRLIGNRAIIYFGEAALTRKVTNAETYVRVARMTDGQPLAGATVTAFNNKLEKLSSQTTDADGVAAWKTEDIRPCAYFLAQAPGVTTLQPLELSDPFPGGSWYAQPPPPLRGYTFTDRPLYRPGQSVQFKGLLREAEDDRLTIPSGKPVTWTIQRQYGDEVLARGETTVDSNGSWNAAWTPPEDGPLGDFAIKVKLAGQPVETVTTFRIEEFRNPPFSVICEEQTPAQAAESVVKVSSQYFHGAPNVGSRVQWTASWSSDSSDGYYDGDGTDMTRVDSYSEKVKAPTYFLEATGEAALDANGQTILKCRAPFTDPGNRANCLVTWKVEVTGPDGQTIPGGVTQTVPMADTLLGVKREDARGGVAFSWDAKTVFGEPVKAVNATLYHVVTKTVKERLARNVYRYRNFDQYLPVTEWRDTTKSRLEFAAKEPGRYVVVVSPPVGKAGFPVSEQTWLTGEGDSEVPVQGDTSATVFSIKGARPGDVPWQVGETAAITVLAPSGGVAWVSVETDKVLDTFTAPIRGNTSRIEIPVKPEYEPNVFVTVYLLKPGGTEQLAGEMFGSTKLAVISPTRRLDVAVATEKPGYEPREKISGEVTVTAGGQPVAGADLAIYAVDDSILTLGDWMLPSMISSFFPERTFAVTTYAALQAYVDRLNPSWLTMKGFAVGDGGEEAFGNTTFTRKEFKPLILWEPNVKTNAKGVAKFTCEAPDNLTRFRVVAVGQTRESQFGAGDTTFTVARRLAIDPALPRFLREGDEVELRAVVRQKVGANEKVAVRCLVSGGLELLEPNQKEVTAVQDAPAVVSFKARATAVGDGKVTLQAALAGNTKINDSVEVPVPVEQPVILEKETVAGAVGNTTFAPREVAPGNWEGGVGTFTLAISTTPWLPKLLGLPFLLQYPHGCFEQKSSKLLGYTYLAGLLAYLPDADARKGNYETVISEVLDEAEASLLEDGRLPYWPGGTEANNYVTIQMAWCVSQAEKAGFAVPEQLASQLPEALNKIATNEGDYQTIPTLRAFAFFVLSTFGEAAEESLQTAANDLYLKRDQLSSEGKAMLALALHRWNIAPDHQQQLVTELPREFTSLAFRPDTFTSAMRSEAICTWARLVIVPAEETPQLTERLSKLLESSQSLSTQENLWLLVAFDALLKKEPVKKITPTRPRPDITSPNGSAVSWKAQDLAKLADTVIKGLPSPQPPGSFVLSAGYRKAGERQTPLVNHGMRIERVVKNLTDAKRDGSAEAPFKLGDQILISYRFSSDKAQDYVALEDLLPGGLEVVNPDLALFGKYYNVPMDPGTTADLSHSEMRDTQTNLYFDTMEPGAQSYSVLARATAAGTFLWPATQITPMYDSRFFGRSPSSTCVVESR